MTGRNFEEPNNELQTMRITDPNGISLQVKALDIDISSEDTIRIWKSSDGLRIEVSPLKRLSIFVRAPNSLDLSIEDK